MRLLAGVMALSLLGAAGAEAAWFGRKLPKPIDFPIVRKNVREHHKTGKRQRHPKGPSPFVSQPSTTPAACA